MTTSSSLLPFLLTASVGFTTIALAACGASEAPREGDVSESELTASPASTSRADLVRITPDRKKCGNAGNTCGAEQTCCLDNQGDYQGCVTPPRECMKD